MDIQKANNSSSAILSAYIGTALEWYDFSIFAFLAPILSHAFFPSQSRIAATLSVYAIFAVGFLVRPLGAAVFGYYGDRVGRKKVLVVSLALISLSTTLMGVLPTYEKIGIFAPLLLVLLRLMQGFCVGGETTGAAAFVLESCSNKYRGMLGSFIWSAAGVGILLASLVATLITRFMSHEVLYSVGWRIPFLFGLVTGVIGYYFRRNMSETFLFSLVKKAGCLSKSSLLQVLTKNRKSVLILIGLYMLSAMITYLVFVFMPTYAISFLGIAADQAQMVATIALASVTFLVPAAGYLSDRVGRKPCLLVGAFGFLLLSYPLYFCMAKYHTIASYIGVETCFVLLAIIYQGTVTSAAQEMTQTSVRYTVTAIGYNLSYSLFGGTAPLVATYIVHALGNKSLPGLYLALGGLVAVVAVLSMRETARMEMG